jgi:hypothetical protein
MKQHEFPMIHGRVYDRNVMTKEIHIIIAPKQANKESERNEQRNRLFMVVNRDNVTTRIH